MKRTLVACITLGALAAVSMAALAADVPTYKAPFAKAAIKVDGVLEAAWDVAPKVSMTPTDAITTSVGMVWGAPLDAGDFKLMWDDKYLYWGWSVKAGDINVEAEDGAFWQRDCVSGFLFDADKEINIKYFTAPKDSPAYTLTGTMGSGGAINEDVLTGYKITKTGYDVEVALPWASISNLKAIKGGETMGFTTLVIDQHAEWGQYMWCGQGDTPDTFATLQLVK